MPKLPSLPGYKRIGGRAERYETPEGKEISRRQYENLRRETAGLGTWGSEQKASRRSKALAAGWNSWREYNMTRKTPQYRRFKERYREVYGPDAGKVSERPNSTFNREYVKAKRSQFSTRHDGEFHDFLVFLDWRSDDTEYDVGETQPGMPYRAAA